MREVSQIDKPWDRTSLHPPRAGDCSISNRNDGDVSCWWGAIPNDHCCSLQKNVFSFHRQNVPNHSANLCPSLSNLSFISLHWRNTDGAASTAHLQWRSLHLQAWLDDFSLGKVQRQELSTHLPLPYQPQCCTLRLSFSRAMKASRKRQALP